MLRFKWTVLLIHAAALSLCFLPTFLGIIILVISLIILASFIKRFFSPLEKMILGAVPFPIEKHAFTDLALTMNAMAEKIKEGKIQSAGQDKDLSGILNALNEGILAFNVRSKVTFVNEKACQMLGLSKNELMGRSLLYFGGFLQKCHEMVLHALQAAESTNEKWIANGIYYDLVAAPLVHQEGAILVIQDKTADHKILEVGKNFIANASHEIRTPITVIRGFAEMLEDQSPSPNEMTGKIVRTCDRLDKLVKSLLELTDLENVTRDRFKPCHIPMLVENCKNMLSIAYPEVQLTISTHDDNATVQGDFNLLGSALMNVLENAVKYSENPIHLNIQKRNECVEITVQDQGIGIPTNDLPHIFDRFYTVDKARSRKSGGVGLGLSIVKLIIEKHLGKVSVASEIGKGSSFTLSLPS
ncbi:MAG TPA: ATP-binding protein [Chlamydiales bacterium]|nr:ATP-binding protein [Chlamydiales bacterium]